MFKKLATAIKKIASSLVGAKIGCTWFIYEPKAPKNL
jgi:cyclic lactone autoinducer peptide